MASNIINLINMKTKDHATAKWVKRHKTLEFVISGKLGLCGITSITMHFAITGAISPNFEVLHT